MYRRLFIGLLSGAAALPLATRAQQSGRVRRIGVLMNLAEGDSETRVRLAEFLKGLDELGWTVGRNMRIDYRWGVGDLDRHHANAAELVALAPDVILAHGGSILRALKRATRTVPIVFVSVADPVGGGVVASLARPGGNATGFALYEYGLAVKWLELLKQLAPQVRRVAVIRDPDQAAGGGQLGAIQVVAPSLGMELSPIDVRDAAEMERAIAEFARLPNGGMIVATAALAQVHRRVIIDLAARHRLPAIYPYRFFVPDGGLIAYGADQTDQYRRAAGYVDRILKGEKPADMPVQQPTKYELAVNLKTAKVLRLVVPEAVLLQANEVIE